MTTDESTIETLKPLTEHDRGETYVTPAAPESVMPLQAPVRRARVRRKWVLLSLAAAALIFGVIVGVPRAIYAWNHVSTDDAIVNGHLTYISSRVSGLAQQVLVDDNQFVEAGTPIIRIDRTAYQLSVEQRNAALSRAKLAVAQEFAALDLANAQLEKVRSEVRSKVADLRGAWYLVATVQDFVRLETAVLQSNVADLREQEATLKLAQQEYDRVEKLNSQTVSQEDIDQRKSAVLVAQAKVASSEASVLQTRALLGLGPDAADPGAVPSDVGQTFNGTQYALSTFLGSFA